MFFLCGKQNVKTLSLVSLHLKILTLTSQRVSIPTDTICYDYFRNGCRLDVLNKQRRNYKNVQGTGQLTRLFPNVYVRRITQSTLTSWIITSRVLIRQIRLLLSFFSSKCLIFSRLLACSKRLFAILRHCEEPFDPVLRTTTTTKNKQKKKHHLNDHLGCNETEINLKNNVELLFRRT